MRSVPKEKTYRGTRSFNSSTEEHSTFVMANNKRSTLRRSLLPKGLVCVKKRQDEWVYVYVCVSL